MATSTNGLLTDIALFISGVDVSSIHTSAAQIAKVVATTATPGLLLIAVYVRILGHSLDTFSGGGGKWAQAVKDIMLWGFVCATYFAIGNLIIDFANGIYKWCDSIGGLQLLTKDMAEVTRAISAQNGEDIIDKFKIFGPLTLATCFFYYFSLILVAFLAAALKIAHALCFGFAFIWGLIAIPISVSEGIKLLRGWALLLGFAILWPLVQALLIALIRPSFIVVLNEIISQKAASVVQNTDIVLTLLNFIFAATLIVAPYLAQALVANAPAGAAVVTPFIGAAMAGAAAAFEGVKMAGGAGGGGIKSGYDSVMKPAKGSGVIADSTSGSGNAPSVAASPDVAPTQSPTAGNTEAKQKQQRRGIIIRQQQKPGG